jgi:hypothetical protein
MSTENSFVGYESVSETLSSGYSAAAGMMAALNRRAIDVVPTGQAVANAQRHVGSGIRLPFLDASAQPVRIEGPSAIVQRRVAARAPNLRDLHQHRISAESYCHEKTLGR